MYITLPQHTHTHTDTTLTPALLLLLVFTLLINTSWQQRVALFSTVAVPNGFLRKPALVAPYAQECGRGGEEEEEEEEMKEVEEEEEGKTSSEKAQKEPNVVSLQRLNVLRMTCACLQTG